jgi:hypothetical protein
MRMRVLLVVLVFAILEALLLAGCGAGGGDSQDRGQPYKPKTEQAPGTPSGSATEASTGDETATSAVIGDGIERTDFEFRVLAVTQSETWNYPETVDNFGSESTSYAGRFNTVWYSVRNTGTSSLSFPNLTATVTADTGEKFSRSGDAVCPQTDPGPSGVQPRGLAVGCMVFDMPSDTMPDTLKVNFGKSADENAIVDLTRANLGRIGPDETLAMQYEFYNVEQYGAAYDLFDSESRQKFTLAQYEAGSSEEYKRYPISSYAFPSVRIHGDRAEVERVLTLYDKKNFEPITDRKTQQFVREDGVWRIIARDSQVEFFSGF